MSRFPLPGNSEGAAPEQRASRARNHDRERSEPSPTLRSKRRSLVAGTVGNVPEWYEWSAYAVFAPFIATAVFHASDSVSALLSTLAVFAVGFLMRPLGGIVFVAIFGGSALAFSVGGVVTSVLSDGEVARWGWRVPFVLGAFLALAALYLRRGMDESDVFAEERSGAEARPLPKGQVARAVLLVIMMTSGITAAHHTWTSYVSTYAITQKGTDA